MPDAALEKRVEMLEKTVNGPNGLVEQITVIRTEVSQLRVDVGEFRGEFLQHRTETRTEFSAVRQELANGFAVIARISLIQEGLNGGRTPRRRRR